MKTKPGFKLRPLGKEYVIAGEGLANMNFNKIIALNETAAYLWRNVEGVEFDVNKLGALLQEEYDIDEDRALADAASLAKAWVEAGIVEE